MATTSIAVPLAAHEKLNRAPNRVGMQIFGLIWWAGSASW